MNTRLTHRLPRLLLALPLAGLLAACASTDATTPVAGADVLASQSAWSISAADANGRDLLPNNTYRLQFADGRLATSGGCNRMNGAYRIDGERLHVDGLAATRMACPQPGVMENEAMLGRLLAEPMQMQVLRSQPPQLRLRTSDGSVLALTPTAAPPAHD